MIGSGRAGQHPTSERFRGGAPAGAGAPTLGGRESARTPTPDRRSVLDAPGDRARIAPGYSGDPTPSWDHTPRCRLTDRRSAESGTVESFNGKVRDESSDGEIFYTLTEAQVIIERWRYEYNTLRPHSSRGDRPPAPDAVQWPAWPRNEKLLDALT